MTSYTFKFGEYRKKQDETFISMEALYNRVLGYGFFTPLERSKNEDDKQFPGDFALSPRPSFVVKVANGTYKVTVVVGDEKRPAHVIIKTGAGRLVLGEIKTEPGQFRKETFACHVDDGYFKIAFLGEAPYIDYVELELVEMPTIYLVGDSTVTDQAAAQFPYTGWGQVFPKYLSDKAAVANYARSGRSSKSFIDEGRLDTIWEQIKPNDFLMIQFGHNDQKPDERGTEPFSSYKNYLNIYIDGAKQRGAIPILVTSMHRRTFDHNGQIIDTHGEYIKAMKELSVDEGVELIDLHEKSKHLYERYGPERSKDLFMWAKAGEFEQFPEELKDDTHFNLKGAKEISTLVVEEIIERNLSLKHFLR
ncbi:rhamnogalacturonan acetylesterase [Halalkalibacter urbisdiaboli]|uniref:rhamnogalacturonan acetylesterase n=1 Tax=Halalkalibacter urbisdiaboli TaxID=1960589 RepID=UPI000B44CCF1|nr:rhamnogalacturonan acetylesterase [Halalkalibacter urbisdiaboli]